MGNQAAQRLIREGAIQAKLTVSQPADEFEQQADRMADAVMRMADPGADTPLPIQGKRNRPIAVQRMCKGCENEVETALGDRKEETGEDVVIHAKQSHSGNVASPALESTALNTLDGGGQPLPVSTRSFFERRMGYDFEGVRVHTDARADELARSVNARAFTHAGHLVFRAGEYAPGTLAGRHLLAHELSHTIQQGASPSAERSALAHETSSEVNASLSSSPVPAVQRVCEVTPPPADMECPEAVSSTGSGTPILFGLDSSVLSPADRGTLSAIAAAWHTGGGVAVLRIDGFASCDGPAALNWRLSCRRAQAVATELEAPSDGSPGVDNGHIEIFANGETDQFSTTSLPPNRRVVITGGGAPPPGPPCPLTIAGPDEVDHYCAAYVPSDAASCGVFPAPTIVLTVTGAAAGATLRWSIARGSARASILGPNTAASVVIQGDAASAAQGDVTVQVTDGTCTTPHFLTVREPSQMTAAQAPTTTPTFIRTVVTYTVLDQFGNPMGANICIDETVTVCADNHPELGAFTFGDAATDANGQAFDNLATPLPAAPPPLCTKLDQILTAGGCGPLLHNTILFRPAGITLTHNDSCVSGGTCP